MQFPTVFQLLALAGILAFTACEKDPVETNTSEVSLAFDYLVNGNDFAYDTPVDINGTMVTFHTVQFYVSAPAFEPETGDPIALDDTYLLVKPDSGPQFVAELDKGHYHMLEFAIGVSPEDNSQTEADFTSRPANDPLSIQTPPMHWNWNAGYIFFRIDGLVDTDGDGTPETAMEYHIGTNNMRRELSYTMHGDVEEAKTTMTFDLHVEDLFAGIDLSTDYSCHTGDAPALAATFADNLATAIAR